MIKLSKKGSYALKAILFIADKTPKLVKIKDISTKQNISEAMLRRIIADLERGNILKTIKGRNGGVELSKDVSELSIYDILLVVGENLGITDCTSLGQTCKNIENCNTTIILNDLQKGFNSILKLYTIDKIIKK